MGFFKFIELEEHLSEKPRAKVDIVTPDTLKPLIKPQVMEEAVYAEKRNSGSFLRIYSKLYKVSRNNTQDMDYGDLEVPELMARVLPSKMRNFILIRAKPKSETGFVI